MLIRDDVIPEEVAFIDDAAAEEEQQHQDHNEEEVEEAPEPGVQYDFVSRDLVFTTGGLGQNVFSIAGESGHSNQRAPEPAVNDDEDDEDAPEPGVQYDFVSRDLVFTTGGAGQDVLNVVGESRFHEESTIMHRHEDSHQRNTDHREMVEMDETPDEDEDKEALAE